MHSRLAADGFLEFPRLLATDELEQFDRATREIPRKEAGQRNLLDSPQLAALGTIPRIRALVAAILGPQAFPVRALLFDKTATANWCRRTPKFTHL